MLAFTTVALGGFRGLISNFPLDPRERSAAGRQVFRGRAAGRLDHEAGTDVPDGVDFSGLEHVLQHFREVQGFPDRWRWVEHGIELMRDDGLRYNPNSVDLYREVAWQFQHKMGANLDDANMYYKSQWALEMTPFFRTKRNQL